MTVEDDLHQSSPLLSVSDPETLSTYSLVLSAANIAHRVAPGPAGDWVILVHERQLLQAEFEISAFDLENSNWPAREPAADNFTPVFKAQSLLLIGSLMLLFAITGPWSEHNLWFKSGSANSTAILLDGEFYRLITSLTLHADIVHLLGNCFLGGVLLHYYFQLTGNGIGLSLLLITSTLANLINASIHGPGHNSVGFSTAVFAVIGILSSLNYRQYKFSRPVRLFMPLMAGAALLAMLGSSGERTDLGAHLFGLLTGLAAGALLVVTNLLSLRSRFMVQTVLAIVAMTIPLVAWRLAFL